MSVEIKIPTIDGLTLNTKNKFIEDDITITIDQSLFEQDYSVEDGLITRTLTSYYNDRITTIGANVFYGYATLTKIDVPNVTSIGTTAFARSGLIETNFPKVDTIASQAFANNSTLKKISLPSITSLTSNALREMTGLEEIYLDNIQNIAGNGLYACYVLKRVVIRYKGGVTTLANTSAFNLCYHILGTTNATYNPEGLQDGYIYVPDELLEDYKISTNWSTYSTQIKGLSELPQDIREEIGL